MPKTSPIHSTVSTEHRLVTDRQTDRHRAVASTRASEKWVPTEVSRSSFSVVCGLFLDKLKFSTTAINRGVTILAVSRCRTTSERPWRA